MNGTHFEPINEPFIIWLLFYKLFIFWNIFIDFVSKKINPPYIMLHVVFKMHKIKYPSSCGYKLTLDDALTIVLKGDTFAPFSTNSLKRWG